MSYNKKHPIKNALEDPMKRLILLAILLTNAAYAQNETCGRFADPIKSILKDSTDIQFDFRRISILPSTQTPYCFYYAPRGARCDLTYNNQKFSFFFNDKFTKADVDNSAIEKYFIQWLTANTGQKATINTYNTLFEMDNDFENAHCVNWYEQLTYTLTIDGKESIILEN